MSLKIDISLCRVCCKSEATHSIYKYAKKFLYCTSIKVTENDGLPDKICDQCLDRMGIAVEFKKKSEFSDRQLKSFIANVNNQFMALEGSGNDEDSDDEERAERQEKETPNEDETFTPKNSVLGHGNDTIEQRQAQEESAQIEREPEEAELSTASEPGSEPEPESEPEQEQEKFRAVAVIQEKPVVKAEKNVFEMVEVEDYEENLLQQEGMEVEEHESDQQNQLMDESEVGEEQEQVIYIGFTTEYHEEEEDAQIPEDDEISVKRDDFSDVSEVDHSYRQPKYATLTRLDSSMSTTKSSPSERPRSKFECVECVKSFSTKTNLNRHLQTHNGNKPFACPLCQKGFTQSGSLKQHLLIHQNLRPYVCTICGQGFTQQKTLTFHMRRHTNEKPFVCPHCSYAFRQKDGLKRHVLVKHTEKDAKSFRCDECEHIFQSRYALSMHRKRQESGVHGSCRRKTPDESEVILSVELKSEVEERVEAGCE
ncbi:zinc finger protein 543-like [Ochlerotatus camptorhynchus]|uniref:zinc finger protein 543-like n=1 Tax=Ochlerotatus camptorhynchus TaxID=644619 RepID=UPI0031D51232